MKSLRHSLALKIFVAVLICISIVFVSIFIIVRNQIKSNFTSLLQQKGENIGDKNQYYMDRIFSDSQRLSDTIINNQIITKADDERIHDFIMDCFVKARAERPELLAVVVAYEPEQGSNKEYVPFVTYKNGEYVKGYGKNYLNEPWYVNVKKTQKPLWANPFKGFIIPEPLAAFTAPIFDTDGKGNKKFVGVLAIDQSIGFLQQSVESISAEDKAKAFVISSDGTIVAHENEEWCFKESINSLTQKIPSLKFLFDEMTIKGKGIYLGKTSENNESFVYFTPLKSNDWIFGVEFPIQELFAQERNFEHSFLVVALISLVFTVLFVLIISIRVTKPLKTLSGVANEIGKGNFDIKIPENCYTDDEIGSLSNSMEQMELSLISYTENLKAVTSAKEKIENELKLAREIQKGILPKIVPPFPKCDTFEISSILQPAKEVGGDLFDHLMITPDKLCMAIGDVSGKGVPASLFMAVTQTFHRGLVISKDNSPQQIVSSLNSFVSNNNIANMFVTYLFAIVDLKTGIMSYCNAGHNPFYVIRADGSVEKPCKRHGIPLGVMSDREYGQSDLPLNHGDMVVLYTDGVTEANNSKEELFGDKALVTVLEKCGAQHLSAEETKQAIFDAVVDFETGAEQFDDITILCFKYL